MSSISATRSRSLAIGLLSGREHCPSLTLLMAITGHRSVSEVLRYTRTRDQERLVEQAMSNLKNSRAFFAPLAPRVPPGAGMPPPPMRQLSKDEAGPTGGKLRLLDLLDGAWRTFDLRRPDEVGASGARHEKAPASMAAIAMSRASFAVTKSKPVIN